MYECQTGKKRELRLLIDIAVMRLEVSEGCRAYCHVHVHAYTYRHISTCACRSIDELCAEAHHFADLEQNDRNDADAHADADVTPSRQTSSLLHHYHRLSKSIPATATSLSTMSSMALADIMTCPQMLSILITAIEAAARCRY